jgi:hypothetical protein
MRARCIAAVSAASLTMTLIGMPVLAQQVQQPSQPPGSPSARPLDLTLPPPADTGKGRPYAPSLDPAPASGCAVIDCRLRIIGAVQHNGAVELNGALFKW